MRSTAVASSPEQLGVPMRAESAKRAKLIATAAIQASWLCARPSESGRKRPTPGSVLSSPCVPGARYSNPILPEIERHRAYDAL